MYRKYLLIILFLFVAFPGFTRQLVGELSSKELFAPRRAMIQRSTNHLTQYTAFSPKRIFRATALRSPPKVPP